MSVEVLIPAASAVGGVPVERAIEWIEKVETLPRGWYAGPIGWFDERGDSDFSVALRSCLLREGRARVYAGAGIVDASDPELEWQETEVKQASVLEALAERSSDVS